MKTLRISIILLMAIIGLGACGDDEPGTSSSGGSSNPSGDITVDETFAPSTEGDVQTFTVNLDSTALQNETEIIPTDDEDYVENAEFGTEVHIKFDGSSVSYSGQTDSVNISTEGAHVTVDATGAGISYIVTGSAAQGSLKIYSKKKLRLQLAGLSLTNPTGAAINIQSKKRTYIVVADGTQNQLTDGTTYSTVSGEDMKATLFSEGQIIFSGKGLLTVNGTGKNGICSDEYIIFRPGCNIYVAATANHGIKANETIEVRGGVINVLSTATAAKGIKTDGNILISGGRTTVKTTGDGTFDSSENDAKGAAGLKCDSTFAMTGGLLLVESSGSGGKGVKTDMEMAVSGGILKVITTGKEYTYNKYSASPKGLKADGNMSVTGGTIQVRCSNAEGIETKGTLTINDGTIESYSGDDAINSKLNMTLNGGYIYAHSTGNDGIDSNQNLTINGGVIIAEGTKEPECGLDAAEGYSLYMNGGTVVAMGGNIQATASSSKQASIACSVSSGITVGVYSGSTPILAYEVPQNCGSGLMISSPYLESGTQYTLSTVNSMTGGSSYYGLHTGMTLSAGSSSTTATAAYAVGSSQMGGGPGGGMGGGPSGRR